MEFVDESYIDWTILSLDEMDVEMQKFCGLVSGNSSKYDTG